MMKLHYIDEYKEVDIPEIIYRIFEIRCLADIKELLAPRWNSMLIEIIDDVIISQLDLNETTNLEEVFCIDDLVDIREEVRDRLRYLCR
jgi:hypothetical protein